MTYNSCILNGSTSSNRSLKIRKIVSCLTSGEVTTLSRWKEGFESPTGRHIEAHYCLFRRSSDRSECLYRPPDKENSIH